MKRALSVLACVLLAACSGNRAAAPPESPANGDKPKASGELRLAADIEKRWGIQTAVVERIEVTTDLTLPGVIALDQQHTAHISPMVEGNVIEIRGDLGTNVQRDQVLLVIHSPAFAQAKSAFLQAHARRDVARKAYERARGLLEQHATQEKEVQRLQAEYESARTEYGVLESNLHSLGMGHPDIEQWLKQNAAIAEDASSQSEMADPRLPVRSPVAGQIIFRDVVIGEHVHPDKVLFTVSDLSTVWAVLDAREKDLPLLSVGAAVKVRSSVYADRTFAGRIAYVSDVVDDKLRTIKVRVAVPNNGHPLKPNMYIEGVLETHASKRQVLAVAESAVQNIGGDPVVFVRTATGGIAVRPVQLGEKSGGHQVIVSGLDGTEQVVVSGAFNLKSEVLKSTLSGEE